MEKINVTELLKDCPSGMELDCTMYDNLYFDSLNSDYYGTINCYTLIDGIKTSINFTKYGIFNNHPGAKCVIFPKGKTTWEGFQRPFKDGDIVTWKDRGSLIAFIYKERKNVAVVKHHFALYTGGLGILKDGEISLVESEIVFATEEEKAELFGAIKANGYKWNAETKTLEKLEVEVNHEDFQFKEGSIIHDKVYGSTYIFKKYDKSTNTLYYYVRCLMNGDLCYNGKSLFEGSIRRTHEGFISSDNFRLATEHEKSRVHNSLNQAGYQWNPNDLKLVSITKPDISSRFTTFDHVLVRDLNSDIWRADFYYSYDDTPINDCSEGILHTPFKTILSNKNWAQCIPFNLETKHLIDTNLACPEKFVIW